jgi:hypothetical protein
MPYSDECPTCGEVMPRVNHKCPPAWLVRNSDDDESEAYTIYDHTAPGAAEKFCLKMDDGELKPRDRKVTVKRVTPEGDQRLGPTHYDMHAEVVFQYLPF